MARRIDNKHDMYELLRSGALGNAFRTWPSVDSAKADGYNGPYGLRFSGVRGAPAYDGQMPEAEARAAIAAAPVAWRASAVICEEVPNRLVTLNGECQLNPHGLYLRYGLGAGHMKAAMADPLHATGIAAYRLIRSHGGISLYYHLCDLMHEYEGATPSESAVVEFACFSRVVGPEQRNWVVWECRSY
jgi:hypothetical protein